ncbi:3-keto-disaccharide hydrolase [Adhaeretor mobilis]|uniref:3-keto-alpha-glucoside-1,2-lyase/3-keto-2-hydroxy-glucal hydratase domain-containing protein n=1 Tax=Adhaeretor mobilis TaxID=1930276 RepID=A0A517MV90_9BACT|nr:DUF1080 domain-containing protein [Adhaeretor mobilis]QDS98804.1 hypothetical protein HG15A2_20890 [Adhaeretor mobilis]
MSYKQPVVSSGILPAGIVILTALTVVHSFLQSSAIAAETPVVNVSDNAAPSDAVVIFDGSDTDKLLKCDGTPCDWLIEHNELVVPGAQRTNRGVWTTYHFRDAQIHVEFLLPRKDRKHGNSGLYLHGICELQIYASREKAESPELTIGALYGIAAPLVNAGKSAGKWQTYDVLFTAPRRDKTGKVIKSGRVTALLNGVLVQHKTEFAEPRSKYAPMTFKVSPYTAKVNQQILLEETGPLYLQDHDSQVRFRNVWIRPLDDKAGWFVPNNTES